MSKRTVLVTGAAAGIGHAIAVRFATAGWLVGLYDIDGKAVEAAAERIEGGTLSGELDVSDPEGWDRCLAELFEAGGNRLDLLVNNAGVLVSGPFTETPLERHHQIIDVNVKGVLNGCHSAFPYLKRTPGSRVINIGSASAFYGQPGLLTYAASKAAVRSITEALELEWRPYGIAVHDLQPMYVNTAMVVAASQAGTVRSLGVRLTPDDVAERVWATVMGRRLIPRTHVTVGTQGRLLGAATKLSPSWLTRAVMARLSRTDYPGPRPPTGGPTTSW